MADIELFEVDIWVEVAAKGRVLYFYPSAVASRTGLPVQKVFDRLIQLVDVGYLVVEWEVRCDNYNCPEVLSLSKEPPIGKYFYCEYCDEEIECTPDNTFPRFSFCPGYKEMIKKKVV
ncbi:MAG: hypothetical protein LOD89_07770 [Tissierellales bacterium]